MTFLKNTFFHAFILFLIILAQSFYPASPVTLALPDFVIIVFFYFAVYAGWERAYLLGFFCGLVLDFFNPGLALGLYAFIFTLLGFASGHLKGKLFFGKIIFPIISIFSLTLAKYSLLGLLYLIFAKSSEIAELDGIKFLIEFGFNLLFAIPVYLILTFTKLIDLNNKESIL